MNALRIKDRIKDISKRLRTHESPHELVRQSEAKHKQAPQSEANHNYVCHNAVEAFVHFSSVTFFDKLTFFVIESSFWY